MKTSYKIGLGIIALVLLFIGYRLVTGKSIMPSVASKVQDGTYKLPSDKQWYLLRAPWYSTFSKDSYFGNKETYKFNKDWSVYALHKDSDGAIKTTDLAIPYKKGDVIEAYDEGSQQMLSVNIRSGKWAGRKGQLQRSAVDKISGTNTPVVISIDFFNTLTGDRLSYNGPLDKAEAWVRTNLS